MKASAIVATILGCLVIAYFVAFPVYTFRYRLTVEVEADGVVKSGSSVIQVRWVTLPPIIPMGISKDYEIVTRGEAVVVDLSPKPMLVVGLYGDADPSRSRTSTSAYNLLLAARGLKVNRSDLSEVSSRREKIDVPISLLPKLIVLENPSDVKTLRLVGPTGATNDLGVGYRLLAATAEITDAPITHQIREKLPWLNAVDRDAVLVIDRGHGSQAIYRTTLIEDETPPPTCSVPGVDDG